MTANQILTSDLLDLIFDDRNKLYGAYELRKTYSARIKKALLATGLLVSLVIGATLIGTTVKDAAPPIKLSPGIIITEIEKDKTVVIEEKKQKQQAATKPVRTEKLMQIKIVPDEVKVDEIPTQDELKIAAIGPEKTTGEDPGSEPSLDVKIGGGNGIIEGPKEKENKIHEIVQVQAKYAGNWEKFLTRNLDPEVPIDNGAPTGRYTVIVQFVVDLDGSVSDIKPLTSHGYGLEEEAIRVLKKASKWEPGIQNGYPVKSYRKQPITFVVENY